MCVASTAYGIGQAYAQQKLDSLYGGYSGNAAAITFTGLQFLNPEEKIAVIADLVKVGDAAKLAKLESEASKAGKLDELKQAEAAARKDVANALKDEANESEPNLTIRDHYEHHRDMTNDLKTQLKDQGYRVSEKEISFGNSCGTGRCRPDIVYETPEGKMGIIEVKTGNADLTIRQSEIYPQISSGDAIPRGRVADAFGLKPGIPLKDQGYPNGIPVEVRTFPGAGR